MTYPKTGLILREFAACFKDKKLRARYPYVRLTKDRITCTDSFMVLDFKSDKSVAGFKNGAPVDGAYFIKAEHAGQLSTKDDILLDASHVEGTASGLIIPHASDGFESAARFFSSVDNFLRDSFTRRDAGACDVNSIILNCDYLRRICHAFKKCGFDSAVFTIIGDNSPICVESVRLIRFGKESDANCTMRAIIAPIRRK